MRTLSHLISALAPQGRLPRKASKVADRPAAFRALVRAAVETVESKVYLTTFNGYIDALKTGSFGSAYYLHLYTSGGQASKWVVDWKDGSALQTLTPAFPATTFDATYSIGHTYSSGAGPTAPIAATATLSGSSTTATATYALSQSYGSYQFQNSGRSTFTVSGTTINADYTAIDPSTGDEYVAFAYNPGGTSHNLIAIARFNHQGQIDDSWGSSGNGILYHQTGDTGNDTPYAIAAGDGNIMVVGSCPSGWLVEGFTDAAVGMTFGQEKFTLEGTGGGLFGSKATGVSYDSSDEVFEIVGNDSNATDFAMAQVSYTGTVEWTKTYSFGCNAINVYPTCIVEEANSDIGLDVETVFAGGYLSFSGSNAHDMVVIAVSDGDGSLDTSFGNYAPGVSRWNIGSGSSNCVASGSSADMLYSLVPWVTSGGTDVVTAVGSTCSVCGAGTTQFALETFKVSDGSFYTGYGSGGVALGPSDSGTPTSAFLYYNVHDSSNAATNDIFVSGTNNSGDFEALAFNTSGSVDTTNFGNSSGYWYVDFGSATTNTGDQSYSIFMNTDGSIVLAGTSGGSIALADVLLKQKPTFT